MSIITDDTQDVTPCKYQNHKWLKFLKTLAVYEIFQISFWFICYLHNYFPQLCTTGCKSDIWKKVQVNISCTYICSTETNYTSAEIP